MLNAQVTDYVYRADGTKVKKLFGNIETNYLDGFQYKSTKPSEGGLISDPNEVAVMKLRIIPTAEGYFDALSNQYIYNYTDHLGNVRLSYSDTNKDGVIQSRQYLARECSGFGWNQMCIDIWRPGEIVETNTYYPFGLMHNYAGTTQNAYQYKYNGKELQETGNLDYGWRQYMPDIGRWFNVDPLSEKSRRLSTYTYALNNPIMFIDPDGREALSGLAAQQAFINFRDSMPPDDYIDTDDKYLGSDGASTKDIRMIYRTEWENITSMNKGSLSAEATKLLQASSSIITIDESTIATDINDVNNETIKDQHHERQTYIGIKITRGDIPIALVTSVRGEDGFKGKVNVDSDKIFDKATGAILKYNVIGQKNMLLIAGVHSHDIVKEEGKKNDRRTSEDDRDTAHEFGISNYAIDSWTGASTQGNAIHRVMSNGVATQNIGTTINQNIGRDALNNFINKQRK